MALTLTQDDIMAVSRALRGDTFADPGLADTLGSDPSLMYRGIPQPRSLWQAAMPMVGKTFMGMNDPMLVPRADTPGISIFEHHYMQRVSGRQYQQVQANMLQDYMQGLGADGASVLTRIGAHNMFNQTAQEFSQNLSQMGTGTAGQLMGAQMLQHPFIQELMGGDVMGARAFAFGRRHTLGEQSGDIVSPTDMPQQRRIQEHTEAFMTELTKAIRGYKVDGSDEVRLGTLPNYDFTRGFRDEQLTQMASYMGERGDFNMRGGDPRAMTQRTGEMARVMEAVRDLVGSDDMRTLFDSLDQLTRQRWPTIDKGALERSLREMTATAHLANVSGTYMAQQTAIIGETMERAVGLTPEAQMLGENVGGIGQLPAAMVVSRNVMAIAKATGRTAPMEVARIRAQQTGLMGMGLQSTQGRALTVVEYLRQNNRISDDDYNNMTQSLFTDDKNQQEDITNMIFRKAFGDATEGWNMVDDPDMMHFLRTQLDAGSGANLATNITASQQTELSERIRDGIMNRVDRRTRRAQSDMGLRYIDAPGGDLGRQAEITLKTTRGFLSDKFGKDTLDAYNAQYDAALERYQAQGMTEPRAQMAAIHAADQMLGMEHLRSSRPELNAARRDELIRERQRFIEGDKALKHYHAQATVDQLLTLPARSEEMNAEIQRIGTITDAGERKTAADALVATLSDDMQTQVKAGRDRRIQSFETQTRRGTADLQAEARLARGADRPQNLQISPGQVMHETQEINRLLGLVQAAGPDQLAAARAKANKGITAMVSLSEDERRGYFQAIKEADADTLTKLREDNNLILESGRFGGQEGMQGRVTGQALQDAINDSILARDRNAQLKAQAPILAAYETGIADAWQSYRMTDPQKALAWTKEDITTAELMGIEDANPLAGARFKRLLNEAKASPTGKALVSATENLDEARAAIGAARAGVEEIRGQVGVGVGNQVGADLVVTAMDAIQKGGLDAKKKQELRSRLDLDLAGTDLAPDAKVALLAHYDEVVAQTEVVGTSVDDIATKARAMREQNPQFAAELDKETRREAFREEVFGPRDKRRTAAVFDKLAMSKYGALFAGELRRSGIGTESGADRKSVDTAIQGLIDEGVLDKTYGRGYGAGTEVGTGEYLDQLTGKLATGKDMTELSATARKHVRTLGEVYLDRKDSEEAADGKTQGRGGGPGTSKTQRIVGDITIRDGGRSVSGTLDGRMEN